ncbi:MAG: tetratricopeptide repeat protein [Bryobacteraceae bacterium]|jgi:tetratricopeptide (TPR) repeat protein
MLPGASFNGRSFLGTLALVAFAIGGLFIVDTFLVKMEQAEDRAEAARLFAEGRKLMDQGRSADAVERLNDAVAIERNNREYRLALAEALLAAGRLDDAESKLNDLLQEDSTDGAANLMMARVMVREGKITEGISFYHRAIYGRWTNQAAQNRDAARFELIDLLVRQNAKEDLLAELLPLQDEALDDLATRKKIGRLFIVAGSPARAAEVFRAILRRHPQDADAYAGLGEAEFASGNYPTAQTDFITASRLNPDDETVRKRLDLCNQVLALNPTRRGLDPAERYRRSHQLLEMALDEANHCSGAQELLDEAAKAVKRAVPASRQGEVSEMDIDLAEQIWQARKKDCKQESAVPEALDLVLAKLAQ